MATPEKSTPSPAVTESEARTPPTPHRKFMTRGLTFLFAVAGGAAVGNLYWAQPLLDFIAEDLHATTSAAGWLVTATQIGYAAGILLLVPLGDVRDRRRLIPVMLLCSAVALLLCALAPSFGMLLVAITLLGVTTVSGQLLAPLAGDLADDADRGRVVGTVVSGILTGILVSRTVSGLVADAAGWRTIYVVAAAVAVVFAALMYRAIPSLPPKTRMPYPALIASVWTVVRREATVRWTLGLGSTAFAAFTMFWTSLTFLLSAPPFSYSVAGIGLFGLLGVAGALAAQRAGRLHDRGLSLPATGIAWTLVLASFVLAAFAGRSVALVVVVIILLDVAVQGVNLLNQSRIFAVSNEARSRLNTAFVTSNFLGGAIGSALASVLWTTGGWTAVTIAGMVLSCFALVVWALGRRGPLRIAPGV
ncbi:MFS transporter [Streptomyces europaeiscabiei]|uniref:MFS transporter n=1 Tax=Streptomyces TaxID=1883 RepID=UPI000A379D8A|nr:MULTISPECIES: MFS transporter [Streptomyces]MDX3637617.1 MFS transporter [Streptomyces europaeiscabiei]MDX3654912.1 MFS transporter [Streptomyces europaeiscabiei]WUD30203.1 MFS transporter [Streptomyces europaeiscabiei]